MCVRFVVLIHVLIYACSQRYFANLVWRFRVAPIISLLNTQRNILKTLGRIMSDSWFLQTDFKLLAINKFVLNFLSVYAPAQDGVARKGRTQRFSVELRSYARRTWCARDYASAHFTLRLWGPLCMTFIVTEQYKVLEGRCEVDSLGFCRVFSGFCRASLGVPSGFPRGSLGVPSGFPWSSLHVGYDSVWWIL
jgi:hypothetical protein